MKKLLGAALLAILALSAAAVDTPAKNVMRDARRMVDGWNAKNPEIVAQFLRSNGKDVTPAEVKSGIAWLATSMAIADARVVIGKPREPKSLEGILVSAIPALAVYHFPVDQPNQRIGMYFVIYAYSRDEGQHWSFEQFVNLDQEAFDMIHPELKKQFTLPFGSYRLSLSEDQDVDKLEVPEFKAGIAK